MERESDMNSGLDNLLVYIRNLIAVKELDYPASPSLIRDLITHGKPEVKA